MVWFLFKDTQLKTTLSNKRGWNNYYFVKLQYNLKRCLSSMPLLGCELNATLFGGEKRKHRLRTLNTSKARKTKLKNLLSNCTINSSSSWYIGCFGDRIPLRVDNKMFLLQRRTQRNAYFIEVRTVLVLVAL